VLALPGVTVHIVVRGSVNGVTSGGRIGVQEVRAVEERSLLVLHSVLHQEVLHGNVIQDVRYFVLARKCSYSKIYLKLWVYSQPTLQHVLLGCFWVP
jgi:hypothetical protein